MKRLFIFFASVLFSFSLHAGVTVLTVVVSENPTVGQEVTFTIDGARTGCELETGDGATVPFIPDFDSERSRVTHTYTAEGTFTLSGDCNGTALVFSHSENSGDPSFTSITVAPDATSAPIPTLGEWGLILLALSLVSIGVVYIKQYQHNTKIA